MIDTVDLVEGLDFVGSERTQETSSSNSRLAEAALGLAALAGTLLVPGTTQAVTPPAPTRILDYGWTTQSSSRGGGIRPAVWSGAQTATPQSEKADESEAQTSEQLKWLHAESGLTWDQISRVIGVSRRAIHLWAGGARVTPANVQRVATLAGVIRDLPESNPQARLSRLFAPRAGRMSLYDELLASNRSTAQGEHVTEPKRALGIDV